ncbi:MAG: hypothetical protein ACJ73E_04305 [Mycobacteriales bacterium]
MTKAHYTAYDEETTARCERALVTLLGHLGPWRERVYLAGGLAARYIVGRLPEGVPPHVGTIDVDLVVGLALGDDAPETYWTLQRNLEQAGFTQTTPSFRWARQVDGVTVLLEFLCETDSVQPGNIFRLRTGAGTKFAAFNVRGAHLVRDDFIERDLERERLDAGGVSRVSVRVANVLPYVVLKILSFQDRHANKDAYDLVFTLLNQQGGPYVAGRLAATSPIAEHRQVAEGISLLAERFQTAAHDGPVAHATFLAERDDPDEAARLRQQATVTVRELLRGF